MNSDPLHRCIDLTLREWMRSCRHARPLSPPNLRRVLERHCRRTRPDADDLQIHVMVQSGWQTILDRL
ncbi:MAG: hypothetical protein GC162_00320 [Planctomycetes bacterium]|nr:hypothetical protein [Planctomycetota bacterium]